MYEVTLAYTGEEKNFNLSKFRKNIVTLYNRVNIKTFQSLLSVDYTLTKRIRS